MSHLSPLSENIRQRNEDWKTTLQRPPKQSSSISRFSIPQKMIRSWKLETFEPKLVSIGPNHHGKPHLMLMEERKRQSLNEILSLNEHKGIEDYAMMLERTSEKVRSYYCDSEDIEKLNPYEFTEMLLLDGCLILNPIIHSLLSGNKSRYKKVSPYLLCDYLLVGNQIPFFILEDIFNLAMSGSSDHNLTKSIISLFAQVLFSDFTLVPSDFTWFFQTIDGGLNADHLLHLFHMSFADDYNDEYTSKFGSYYANQGNWSSGWIPRAGQLHDVDIKFRSVNRIWYSGFQIGFKRGTLKMKPLLVNEMMETLLVNFLYYEWFYSTPKKPFTGFVAVMDGFIDTAEDVALLWKAGIIINGLDSHVEVAHFFNRLGRDISMDVYYINPYLLDLARQLKSYCNSRYQRGKAGFIQTYLSNKWAIPSLIGALVLFFLTFTQTIYTILSYHHPPK